MKQKTLSLLLILFASFAFAQTPAQPTAPAAPTAPAGESKPLAETLEWLVGDWEGDGIMAGDQEFHSTMKATRELDNEAILLFRESMSKNSGQAGGRKEILVVTFEGPTK